MLMLYACYDSHSFLNAFSPYPMKIYKIKQVLSALHEASCRQIFWKKLLTTTNLAQTLPTMGDVMRPNGLVALGLPMRTAINRLVLAAAPVGRKSSYSFPSMAHISKGVSKNTMHSKIKTNNS